jgi:serine-threonine kinase receptor-associated protein
LDFSEVTQDGFFLISSCLDGKPMLREGLTGDWIGTLLGHKGAVWSARLDFGAMRVVTASADFTAKLWDAVTGSELYTFNHKHIVRRAVFSKDGTSILTGGQEKLLRIYDLSRPETDPLIGERGHGQTIADIICSPDDPNVIWSSGVEENGIRIWDKRIMQVVKTLDTAANELSNMRLSSDESIVTSTSANVVEFWDAKTFALVKSHRLPVPLSCAAYSSKYGRFVAGSSKELWVRMYDFETGEELACNKGHHGPVRCICFNPLGDCYASGSEDGTIRIWEWAKAEGKLDPGK